MKIPSQNYNSSYSKQYNISSKANVHIVDGFLHADTMEHFAKAVLKGVKNVDSLKMHYIECNAKIIQNTYLNIGIVMV